MYTEKTTSNKRYKVSLKLNDTGKCNNGIVSGYVEPLIGFSNSANFIKYDHTNKIAYDNPEVVPEYVKKEVDKICNQKGLPY